MPPVLLATQCSSDISRSPSKTNSQCMNPCKFYSQIEFTLQAYQNRCTDCKLLQTTAMRDDVAAQAPPQSIVALCKRDHNRMPVRVWVIVAPFLDMQITTSVCIYFMSTPQGIPALSNGWDQAQSSWGKKMNNSICATDGTEENQRHTQSDSGSPAPEQILYWQSSLPLILAYSQACNRWSIWPRRILRQHFASEKTLFGLPEGPKKK